MQDQTKLFSFALLGDLHLSEANGMDKFHMAMDTVKSIEGVKFVHLLGDIMFDGSLAEFKRMMDSFNLPYRVTFGNHDAGRLNEFQDAFGASYYSFEYGDCLFVNLFNAIPGVEDIHARHGELNDEQKEWMRHLLDEAASRDPGYSKVFLLAHIPPLQPGSPMDPGFRMTVEDTDFIYNLCSDFEIDACFYGHIHRNEVFEFDGTWHISTPSTNWNFNTAFGYQSKEWVPAEYGGFRIVNVFPEEISDELIWTHRGFSPVDG